MPPNILLIEMADLALQLIKTAEKVSDEQLMIAVQQGKREAFDELVNRYQMDAIRLAYHYVKNWEDAKDLAQDAFVKVYTQAHRYDPSQPFRPWFLRVLVNHVLNFLDRKKRVRFSSIFRKQENGEESNLLDFVADEDRSGEEQAARQTVWAALKKLSSDHRNVLILHEIEGLKEREVANILQCSVGTVKSRLHYAKKKMRKILEKEYPNK